VVVELLEREDRQVDVMLLEAKKARGVVHQDIRVEHEQLGGKLEAGGRAELAGGLGGLAGDEGERGGAGLALDHGAPGERDVRLGGEAPDHPSLAFSRTQALVAESLALRTSCGAHATASGACVLAHRRRRDSLAYRGRWR